ncbi:MAG: presenilin family intramembrane aspartyl protease [Candidatus Diapherotrites archaeon]|nr:presenilin family intramembrane aspartyl protease [Candidatus Diapherotrites archaeon]
MQRELLSQILLAFFITQILGIYVAYSILEQESQVEIFEDRSSIINSIFLFIYILAASIILLLFIKFVKADILYITLRIFESMVIFFTTLTVLSLFWSSYLNIIAALLLVVIRNILHDNIMLRNITTIIAVSVAGAIIGISLDPLPLVIFMILLAIYDYIAVFKTKHMVTLANAVTKKNLIFSYAIPTKIHKFELGTGDLAIPLAFASSIFAKAKMIYVFPHYLIFPLVVILCSLLGILMTAKIASEEPGRALPALPLQVVYMVFSYLIMHLSGII